MKPNGYRQFTTAYVEIPKKMGKSELAAAIALYLTCADGEQRAEVYGCAADVNQAKIVFDVAVDATARQNGWMSANDIRELENLDRIPAEEGGDLYLINGNMLPLVHAGAFANINTGKEETNPDEQTEKVLALEKSGGRRRSKGTKDS